ncbi:MAG: ATP-binding protein [Aggregatilineales bacterium]
MTDLLNLFIRSPGESLYYFIIIAISLACLFMALGHRMRGLDQTTSGRYTVALFGIVFVWLLMMGGSSLTVLSDYESAEILPPLERFATTVTVVLLVWAFLTIDSDQMFVRPSALLWIFLALVTAGYGFTMLRWIDLAGTVDFNLSAYGATWTFAITFLSIIGVLLMLTYIRKIEDAPLKLLFFVILLVGYGSTLVELIQGTMIGDDAGAQRLAFVIALLLLPAIMYRMVVAGLETATKSAVEASLKSVKIPQEDKIQAPPAPAPIARESAQLLRALGLMLEDANASNIPSRIIGAIIDVLKTDVVALLRLQDANYADVALARDAVMENEVSGIALNLDNQPTLANAIERRQQRTLTIDVNKQELEDFYVRFDIEQNGPVYFQPLVHEKELVGVLVVASPYAKRNLLDSEQDLLRGVAVIAAGLLALSDAATDARMQAEERAIQDVLRGVQLGGGEIVTAQEQAQNNLKVAREQISELSRQVLELKLRLDEERNRVAMSHDDSEESLSASQQIMTLDNEYKQLREERDALMARLQEAEAALSGAVAVDEQDALNNLVEMLQHEKDELTTQRDHLQTQLDELQDDDGVIPQAVMQNLINQMNEEKARLAEERDQFQGRLLDIQSQLKAFGIEGEASGLAQLIGHLYEQRATLQTQNKTLQGELDRMVSERSRLDAAIQLEEARVLRIQTLEQEVQNLAGDREALTKHLKKTRSEYKDLAEKFEVVKQYYAKAKAQATGFETELKQAHAEQTKLREDVQRIANERSDLLTERDRLLAEKQAAETDRDQYLARIEGDRERLEQVGVSGVGSLTEMIDQLTTQRNQLEHELSEIRNQLATSQNQLEMYQIRADQAVGVDNDGTYTPQDPELLMGLIQELRTPMTSITGYVQLLLSESAGILGEMQRTFLRRVSTNVSRLSVMLDDLVQITELDAGQMSLQKTTVDVVNLIEEALTNASTQFREKGLTVNLSLDPELPPIEADKDSLNQIFGQLLTNAYLVTPPNSEISVIAQRRDIALAVNGVNDPIDCLFVSVEDRGGGVAEEDEPRVFARKYKADNPLIQGIGDTGVGLAIARALVEAQGGQLWLESRDNVGSTFKFALPISPIDVQVEG